MNVHASLPCFIEVKMAANNSIVADAVLEDKLADLWPDYPCHHDVRCPEFKNWELQDKAFQELAEKLGTTCKIIQNFISVKNTNIWGRFDRTAIQLFILDEWVKAKIRALRNSFSKAKKPPASGSARKNPTKRTHWLLEKLQFLTPHVATRASISNIDFVSKCIKEIGIYSLHIYIYIYKE